MICNPIVFGFAGSVVNVEFKTRNLESYYFSLDLNFYGPYRHNFIMIRLLIM